MEKNNKVAIVDSESHRIIARSYRPSKLFKYGLGWNPIGCGYVKGELFVLQGIFTSLICTMILCEVFSTYIWYESKDWNIFYFVCISIALGIGFFIMIGGNLHGAGPSEMIFSLLVTPGFTALAILAPWKSFHSNTEEDVLVITVATLGTLCTLLQLVVLMKRLRGSRRSIVDNYLESSLDYTKWIVHGRPTSRRTCCSPSCFSRCFCCRRHDKRKNDNDDHWSRMTFGKRRASKWNPFRFILTDGINFVPAIVTLAFVMGIVFLLTLSFKLHFFLLHNRDRWIEEGNLSGGTSSHVNEIRDVVLGAFNARTRRFLFGTNLSTTYTSSSSSSSTSLVDVDLLMSWIVPSINASLVTTFTSLSSQVSSSQTQINAMESSLLSSNLVNTTTLSGTNVTSLLDLIRSANVSNALSQVSSVSNITQIQIAIESNTIMFDSNQNLTLISSYLVESSNLQSLFSTLSNLEDPNVSIKTWYDDVVTDFYDACMIGNLIALIWCTMLSLRLVQSWNCAWREVRLGRFRRTSKHQKCNRKQGSWSAAFTFVGYRAGVLFWSFWITLSLVFVSYWRPLRDLWAYLFGLQDTYFSFDPDPVDTCDPSTLWCERNVDAYDYAEFCTANYSTPLYCVKDDVVKYPWFTLMILWIFDAFLIRYLLIDRVLSRTRGRIRKKRTHSFVLLVLSWILMFYYGLIGIVSASIRLILCFVLSFLCSSRSDVSLAGPLDEIKGAWTATVRLSNRDFNPIALTAYAVFLEMLYESRVELKKSVKKSTRRWRRVRRYARAVGSYVVYMKRDRKSFGNRARLQSSLKDRNEETKYDSLSRNNSHDLEKLQKEIEHLRCKLEISERRNKSLVIASGSAGGVKPPRAHLPGPLSRYRRRHSGPDDPDILPLGARIENLEVQ